MPTTKRERERERKGERAKATKEYGKMMTGKKKGRKKTRARET